MTPPTPAQGASRATQPAALNDGAIPGIDRAEALALARITDGPELEDLLARAAALRDARGHGRITYSPKVFIPLTKLCRDVCHYCTFAQPPRRGRAYLDREEVLEIARAGSTRVRHDSRVR